MTQSVALDAPMPAPFRWVFKALERIHAGEFVSEEEVATHYAPWFLESFGPEQILAALRGAAPIAAEIVMLEPEFIAERGTAMGLASSHRNGSRYRWEFDIESDRLCLQVLARGPLPEYCDRVIASPAAEVQVRDYTDVGSGSEHILLLHSFGADVGSWDMMVPHVRDVATVRALDLRGHGRSDLRHGYSVEGCLEDIEAATRDVAGDFVIAGHSLGGYVGLEYAARSPCRALITFDGPVSLRRNDTAEEIEAAPEPLRSVLAEHADTDHADLIAGLTTPALFVLVRGTLDNPEPDDAIQQRHHLADCAIRNGHAVRWVDAEHSFPSNRPELAAQIITEFLKTLSR